MAAEETRLEADRRKALGLAISQIEKQLGKGSIMRMGSDTARVKVAASPPAPSTSTRPSASAASRAAASPRSTVPSRPARPRSRSHLAANVQKLGGVAAYVDAEHALDIEYAKKLGVDIEDLLVSQPDTGEQALEIVEILVRSGAVDIVVIDSVAALVPKAEIEGDMGDCHVGLQARLMSQALRKLTGAITRSKRGGLHQPAAREDRRHVRQPRDDHRWQGAQVLRVAPARHPPHRPGEGARKTSSARTSA